MKIIKVLLLLQFVMLLFLVYEVVLEEDQAVEIPVQVTDPPAVGESSPLVSPVVVPQGETILDEKRLRQIIRSELNAYANSLAKVPEEGREQEPEIDPVENTLRLDIVKQEISYYIQVGKISDKEMQKLQMEISRLDPENRKLMMRELVRALNSGELRGRL